MGITMQEANSIVKKLLRELSAAKAQHGFRRSDRFYICYDHATVHNQIAAVLGSQALIWPQPSHSPDCNKPIEHVHAQVDAGMKQWLRERRDKVPRQRITVEQAKLSAQGGSRASQWQALPRMWHHCHIHGRPLWTTMVALCPMLCLELLCRVALCAWVVSVGSWHLLPLWFLCAEQP